MDFRASDPGCVRYGNFINYYSFHPPEHRIQLLPTDIWRTEEESSPYLAIDVGCNSGELTQALFSFLKKNVSRDVHILGIDLDSTLIERAEESNRYPDKVSYKCLNFTSSENNFLKEYLEKFNKRKFDTVFCFSITMWIHLNEGDEGLKRFLGKCVDISELLVIEPQPWKCYQTAVKRLRKSNEQFVNFSQLEWRTNVEECIEKYLEKNLKQSKLYETEPTKWKRKITFYRNECGQ